jgi:hypothetical protein
VGWFGPSASPSLARDNPNSLRILRSNTVEYHCTFHCLTRSSCASSCIPVRTLCTVEVSALSINNSAPPAATFKFTPTQHCYFPAASTKGFSPFPPLQSVSDTGTPCCSPPSSCRTSGLPVQVSRVTLLWNQERCVVQASSRPDQANLPKLASNIFPSASCLLL